MKRVSQWFKALSIVQKGLVGLGTLILLSVAGNSTAPHSPTSVHLTPASSKTQSVPPPTVTTQTVTETQTIPFDTTTVDDASLPKGTSQVATPGVDGVKTLTYKVTFTDGNQTNKQLVSEVTTTQPVTQVMHVGTYVADTSGASCPNGSYVNSDGATVCSPYSSPTAPSGATALCRDGTYSFSQHRSGTCSYHGGVAQWL